MRWSFKIGKIAGTEIRIHLTLLLLLGWIGFSTGRHSGTDEAVAVIAFVCLAFACVLLHELGHVFVALFFGITTPRIVLYPIGGVAWMKRVPREPPREILIAAAGPAVNLILALVALLASGGTIPAPTVTTALSLSGMLAALFWINIMLGIFNLIPAFPMDGGRILRAFLAIWTPYEKATLIAVRIGEGFGAALAIYSIFALQPILLLISLLLIISASAEVAVVQREHLLEGLEASDAAMSDFHTLDLQDSIHHAVSLILEGSQPDFPVVNSSGQCTAIATRDEIIRVLRDSGPGALVADSVGMIPAQIESNTSAAEAWHQLVESGLPGAAVVNKQGKLVRWLTLDNIEDLLLTRSATHSFAAPTTTINRVQSST